jgi:hypothetical protein
MPNSLSFSNPIIMNDTVVESDWYLLGATAIGKSHIKSNSPCQDNHGYAMFNSKCGIAVVSDGAGSAINSDRGAALTTKSAITIFKTLIEKTDMLETNVLPDDNAWTTLSKQAFELIYNKLEDYALSNRMDLHSLSCTVIVVVFCPSGLLVTHIGDGRAGYRDQSGEWYSLIKPHKGEEANQTVFITSKHWRPAQPVEVSGVPLPESRVIREQPAAFTLMTDGCETHSFECSKLDLHTNKWHDPNIPFKGFFNPIYNKLKQMRSENVGQHEANEKWKNFVEGGNEGLKNEADDKTFLLGILN